MATTEWSVATDAGTQPVRSLGELLGLVKLSEYASALDPSLDLAQLKDLGNTSASRLDDLLEQLGISKPFHRKRLLRAVDKLKWSQPFTLEQMLGEGAFGSVYRGVFKGQQVAIKVVHAAVAGASALTDTNIKRLRREARAAQHVEHEHVTRVIYHAMRPDRSAFFLVMQMVNGIDLDYYLLEQGGILLEAHAVRLISQCLDGLHAVHASGLVHRDIKLANIRLERERNIPIILDFGLAKASTTAMAMTAGSGDDDTSGDASDPLHRQLSTLMRTETDAVVGTPEYVSYQHFTVHHVTLRAPTPTVCTDGS